jgi:GGDEF domain-containing protein
MDATEILLRLDENDPAARGWAGLWAAFTVLAVAGAVSLSVWGQMGPHSTLFVAVAGCLTAVAYLLTALLLSNRLVISRSPALILIAPTYLLCGLAVAGHVITFPGVAPLWKVGPDASHWFWVIWHAAAAIGVIGFVALDDEWANRQDIDALVPGARALSSRLSLGDAGAFMRGPLLLALTLLAGSGVWLWREPQAFASWFGSWVFPSPFIGVLLTLNLTAIVLLAIALRRDSIVRTWLLLAVGASLLDVVAMAWSAGPYTVGWYFSQACALVAASVLPIVLLGDLRTRLYAHDGFPRLAPAMLDPETGVANERGLTLQLGRVSRLALRNNVPLAIAVAAVDDADSALPVLRRLFRSSDVLGRTGEREFAVILTPGSQSDLQWLTKRLEAERAHGDKDFRMRIGVAPCDPSGPRLVGDLLTDALQSARNNPIL